MDAGIISALVTGGLALVGVIVSNIMGNNKIQNTLDKAQAVTDTKLEELTREVRAHNNFAQRIPVVEEQIKVINHRIEDLEKGGTKK
jgi:predicted metal-dependent hydrolase